MSDEDRIYPSLPQTLGLSLEAIRQQMDFDPGFLVDAKCPYPEQLKGFLRRLVTSTRSGQDDTVDAIFKPGDTLDEEADSLIVEVKAALNSMKRLQRDLDSSDDVGERLTFLKNYSSLMDRYLGLQEKAHGLKQMYEFQRLVVDTMEQVLDKDARLDFKERLKKLNGASA
ncbi:MULTISPECIES: hypothetical protein [unclassified Methylobacterium]|uniref:hypothetical protein n=1 Tax=unclassified Methylobacterium TaxID=2615210 RepID=UPI0011C1E500|nr:MULTISPECIES: hypothetical protein [unclassified Methylobacterium]QEE37914.1 hypothetical protein FVA80_02015 [Methylobacterium sp. WL1]TXN59380.1 hypothetical protein FV241_02395 [Methylobacterium sp. WL2]